MCIRDRWVTCVSAIHHIQPGEGVGYGEAFVAQRPTVTATLSVGYADGLPRLMSNKGYVILHEKLAPIVGLSLIHIYSVGFFGSSFYGRRICQADFWLGATLPAVSSFPAKRHQLGFEAHEARIYC